MRGVGEDLMSSWLFGNHIAVACPALQTAGQAALQFDFYAGGNGLIGVFINQLTIAFSLIRDQIVDPVAENAARRSEVCPQSLFHHALDASYLLWPEPQIVVIDRPEVRCEFIGLGSAEGCSVKQFQGGGVEKMVD